MRRALEVAVVAVTAVVLIATSRAPEQCATESLNLRADTTCGPVGILQVSVGQLCNLTTAGADFVNLPSSGNIVSGLPDAGLGVGFTLFGPVDGGTTNCRATPVRDGGANFDLLCNPTCPTVDMPDGAVFQAPVCPTSCGGSLTPQ